MNLKLRSAATSVAIAAALAAGAALPAAAAAEYYVPPSNSAATQYTEAVPSAGGEKSGKRGKVVPAQSLGAENVKKLEAQGPAGKAAAELAAATAPPESLVRADEDNATGGSSGNGGGNDHGGGKAHHAQGGNGSGHGTGGASSGGNQGAAESRHVAEPSGSSALGEIVAQATGSSDDGSLGLWLPLLIVATVVGAAAYKLRARHDRHPA